MTNTEERPTHSPLGASGAERWMNCPGSVELLKHLILPESDEPDYRKEGTAAHEAGAHCLTNKIEGWEAVGLTFNGIEVNTEMAEALQVYLDECNHTDGETLIEYSISHPAHPLFYGTVDYACIVGTSLFINDFKYGQGVIVEVEDNPQIMYYAYGILKDHPEIENVYLRIVQPRGFHPEGPSRLWITTAAYINDWAERELLPAMIRTELDRSLDAGPWCRFCPAKLVCPLMNSLFGAAARTNPKEIITLTDVSVGRSYQYLQAAKSYIKALEEEALRRLSTGIAIDGIKLVYKKANRVFKPEAIAVFTARYPKDAFTVPELKSPAEMERIDAEAKKLVHEFAYTPTSGLTVALDTDKRPAVKVQSTSEAFPDALDKAAEAA